MRLLEEKHSIATLPKFQEREIQLSRKLTRTLRHPPLKHTDGHRTKAKEVRATLRRSPLLPSRDAGFPLQRVLRAVEYGVDYNPVTCSLVNDLERKFRD